MYFRKNTEECGRLAALHCRLSSERQVQNVCKLPKSWVKPHKNLVKPVQTVGKTTKTSEMAPQTPEVWVFDCTEVWVFDCTEVWVLDCTEVWVLDCTEVQLSMLR